MNRLRGLVALSALGALLGGVPWALVRFGRWPISGWPTSDQIRDFGDTVVSDTAVFSVLTVAAWLVWVLFVFSFVVEARAAVRGLQAHPIALAGPVQRSARLLVAAAVVGLTIQHNATSATALPRRAASATSPVPHSSQVVVAESPSAEATSTEPEPVTDATLARAPVVITVGPGDTAWSLADTHLGDGMRWRDLWDANREVVQPDGRSWSDPQVIRVGWKLEVPDRAPPASHASTDGEATHLVARGDTLWDIASEDLGDGHRYPEIFELNQGDVQPDGRTLQDPDLILPGWELELPPREPSPSPPAPLVDGDPPVDEPMLPVAPQPAAEAPAPTQPPPPAAPTSTTPTTTSTHATRADPVEEDAPPGVGNETGAAAWPTAATLAGVTGALAAGLAVRLRRLRRRRGVRGTKRDAPLPQALAATESAIVSASDVPLVRWAGQHLARLMAQLDRRAITGGPVAVEISEETGVELLWDVPQPQAPAPWRAADGGWAWRLAYDPDASVPDAALSSAIPALATIGERQGRSLLLDLEAYGALTVDGPGERVDAFLRSIALELASDDELADSYVITVGVDAGIEHLDRLTPGSIEDGVASLNRASSSVSQALDVARLPSTFAARTGSTVPIEATVVVAGPHEASAVERLVARCAPRRGVAVVAAGVEGSAPAHIQLGDDGTACLTPLGIEFDAVGVSTETADEIDSLLEALVAEPDEQAIDPVVDLREHAGPAPPTLPSGNGHTPADHALATSNGEQPDGHVAADATPELFSELDAEPSEPAMLVRVLGVPAVPDRPGLGRRELILTVYLACQAGPVAASAVQDALWGGKPVETKTVWNVIGSTRKALGDLPDGTPVLPAADRSRAGTLRVARGVTTDLAVMRSLVARAAAASSSEAVDLLREALLLVSGPPFDAVGYDWAYRDQEVAEASTLIEHTTEQLVDLCLEAGLVDVARDTVVRGLRGLPGNEELYRCRMRVEHRAGNLAGVTATYEELVTYLADLDTEPSPATAALFHDLVRPAGRR
ncbi:MAG: BTAD domain-containing putative transcriptional regulator [Actinomycetota bacterium]